MKSIHVPILFVILCSLISHILFAQSAPDTLWTRTYGGEYTDEAHSVLQTADGGFVFAGNTGSYGSILSDVYLVKVDSLGNVVWIRTFGGSSPDEAYKVRQTSDGGFILAGYTSSFAQDYRDMYLIKTNSNGDSLWTRTYDSGWQERAYDVQQTSDGGYILVGRRYHSSYWYMDNYVVKTSANGDTLWTNIIDIGEYYDYAYSVLETGDGGYLIAGSTAPPGDTYAQAYLIKINSIGDTLWTRYYGGDYNELFYSMYPTSDGGVILAGRTNSYGVGIPDSANVYIVKLDASFNTSWMRYYGGIRNDLANSVKQTIDGGYIVAGRNESLDITGMNAWILKTDENGDTLWTATYGDTSSNSATDIQQTTDGGYIVSGYIYSPVNYYDAYLVRIAPEPYMGIISPNGGEQWAVFDSATVQWLGLGFQGGVSIELNRDYPAGDWEVLIDSTENDGEEDVYVSEPLSNFCRIRVSALQTALSDESDADFSIAALHGGYLALVQFSAPMVPIIAYDFGDVECAQTRTRTFYLKNFGDHQIIVYSPEYLSTPEFSRQISCPHSFQLGSGQTAPYQLQITYAPTSTGTHHDSLMIQTTALNAHHNYANFPLSGNCIATPAAPQVTIITEGDNIRLTWNPVTESINGCSLNVDAYLIFYSESDTLPYYYHGYTVDTTYVHLGVIRFATGIFYEVVSYIGSLSGCDALSENPSAVLLDSEEVFRLLR